MPICVFTVGICAGSLAVQLPDHRRTDETYLRRDNRCSTGEVSRELCDKYTCDIAIRRLHAAKLDGGTPEKSLNLQLYGSCCSR